MQCVLLIDQLNEWIGLFDAVISGVNVDGDMRYGGDGWVMNDETCETKDDDEW